MDHCAGSNICREDSGERGTNGVRGCILIGYPVNGPLCTWVWRSGVRFLKPSEVKLLFRFRGLEPRVWYVVFSVLD